MSDEVTFEKPEGLFTEEEERGRTLILEAAGIERGQHTLLVRSRVEEFTVESRVKPADYESARGYARVAPEDLYLNVVIYDPEQKVSAESDAEIFGQAFRMLAAELDMRVVEMANRRADRQIAVEDAAHKSRPKRAALREGGNQQGEVL